MKRLSDEFVGLMRDLDWKLDYSEESVQTLEEMIKQQFGDWRPWRRGKVAAKNLPVASLVGAYLGEVMIRHFGGHWGWMPDFDGATSSVRHLDLATCEGSEAVRERQGGRSCLLLRGAQDAALALASGDIPARWPRRATCDPEPRRHELVNDAESIAVGVYEDDEVVIWARLALVACRAKREQPLDLSFPVVGVEVEMHPAGFTERWWLLDLVEGDVWAFSGRVGEYDPTILWRRLHDVAEGRLPEREHLVETSAADHDRADPNLLPGAICRVAAHPMIVLRTCAFAQDSFPNTGGPDGDPSLVTWRRLCSSLVCDEARHGLGPSRHSFCGGLWLQWKRSKAADFSKPADRARPFDWRHKLETSREEGSRRY
jgi:hypothetical protein